MDCEELLSFLSKYGVPGTQEGPTKFRQVLDLWIASVELSPVLQKFKDFFGDSAYPYMWMKISDNPTMQNLLCVFAIESTNDPVALNELGYLILRRCRFDKMPISEVNYEGEYYEFPEESIELESIFISNEKDNGPEFPDKRAGTDLAIRAFGRAWSAYCDNTKGFSDHDCWRAYFTLDGLRAVLFERRETEALESLLRAYQNWVNIPWEFETPFEIQLNFRELKGYLAGRNEVAAVKVAEDVYAPRPNSASLEQLLSASLEQLLKLLPELATREELLQMIQPLRDNAAVEQDLKRQHGAKWDNLPEAVQRFVVNAEGLYVRQSGRTTDYQDNITPYAKPVEKLLRIFYEKFMDKLNVQPERNKRVAEIIDSLGGQQLYRLAQPLGLKKISDIQAIVPILRRIFTQRNPTAHDSPPVPLEQASVIREMVLGQSGVLWRLSEILKANNWA